MQLWVNFSEVMDVLRGQNPWKFLSLLVSIRVLFLVNIEQILDIGANISILLIEPREFFDFSEELNLLKPSPPFLLLLNPYFFHQKVVFVGIIRLKPVRLKPFLYDKLIALLNNLNRGDNTSGFFMDQLNTFGPFFEIICQLVLCQNLPFQSV